MTGPHPVHVWPPLPEGGTERDGHDPDAECRCKPTVWAAATGAVVVHHVLRVKLCPACGRDLDREPWPHGMPCGHCDDYDYIPSRRPRWSS